MQSNILIGLRISGVRELTHSVPYRARSDIGYPNTRLRRRRPNTWREALVHHALGNLAQRTWPTDRRFLPTHWLYTIILLGTLGFFGLGLEPESPDWGTTINSGRKLLTIYAHPALPPALSLMSLVLGLNLLADGLREQSLKD